MKIIIAGLGGVGKAIVEGLVHEGHSIIVIDTSASKIESAITEYDVKGVVGSCASKEILKEAGVSSADLLIATTSTDELNILSCIMAKKLGVAKTIARSTKEEYSTLFNEEDLGVDLTVNPEHEAALQIARMLKFPSAINVNQFSDKDVEVIEVLVPANSPLIGVQLKDLHNVIDAKILICAAQRGDNPVIPSGNFTIAEQDRLFITGTKKNLTLFFKKLKWNNKAKNCLIIGASTTAEYLCDELQDLGIETKLIEKNKKRANQIAQQYAKIDVILGDGTDQDTLLDEGLDDYDAFVSLTNIDEQNIITSMFAQSQGVTKTITKINQANYYTMLQKSGLYSAISTKTSAVEQVVRFVRRLENRSGSGVKRLFHIMEEKCEILEFAAENSFKEFNVPIQKLDLKRNVLFAGIIRKDDFIIPGGQDMILPNDNVIIVTTEEGFSSLNDILD